MYLYFVYIILYKNVLELPSALEVETECEMTIIDPKERFHLLDEAQHYQSMKVLDAFT